MASEPMLRGAITDAIDRYETRKAEWDLGESHEDPGTLVDTITDAVAALEGVPAVAASPTGAGPALEWESVDTTLSRPLYVLAKQGLLRSGLMLSQRSEEGETWWDLLLDHRWGLNAALDDPVAAQLEAEARLRDFFAAGLAALQPPPAPPPIPALEWKNGRTAVEGDGWSAEFSLTTQYDAMELYCDWELPCGVHDGWYRHPLASEAEAFALADVWCKQLAGIASVLKAHEPVFLACAGALAGTEVRDGG